MGKTVPSYRIALDEEICRWNGFHRALRREDRLAFEELMDMCRSFASESGNATYPTIFEPMVISILLAQQLEIKLLENKLYEILWLKSSPQQQNTPRADPNKPATKQTQGGSSGYG